MYAQTNIDGQGMLCTVLGGIVLVAIGVVRYINVFALGGNG